MKDLGGIMYNNFWKHLSLMTAISGSLASTTVMAAAFQLRENNSALIGQAHADSAAVVGDVATMFNNPASMTYLNNHAIAFSLTTIIPSFRFKPESATYPSYGGATGASVRGSDGLNGGHLAAVPSFSLMYNVNERLKVGMNVSVPFGLRTEYNRDWVGRYHAIKSDLKTYNLNPSAAYKINDMWSVGAGIQIQRLEASLSSAVFPGSVTIQDAYSEIKGDGWGFGGNAGVLFEPKKGTRFGLAYRSHVKHDLDGNIRFDARGNLAGLGSSIATDGGKAETSVTLPETVTLSLAQDVNPKWTVLSDIQLTRWSRIQELRIRFTDSVGAADKVEKFGYKDSWFASIGANYKPCDKWKFKFGVAFDSTPTKAENRSPRVPDESRWWFAGGLEYTTNPNLKLSLDYAYIQAADARIEQNGSSTPGNPDKVGSFRGKFESSTHVLGVRAHYTF